MRTLIYTGPLEGVEVAATGQTVPYGGTVEVDDALAESLLAQADVWADAADDPELDEVHLAFVRGEPAEVEGAILEPDGSEIPVTFTVTDTTAPEGADQEEGD